MTQAGAPGAARPAAPCTHWLRDPAFWLLVLAGCATVAMLHALLPALRRPAGSEFDIPAFARFALLYPVLEEIAFRGVLQTWLARTLPARLGPLSLANALGSALFAAMHLLNHAAGWAAAVFLPSLAFGWLRERHRGVAAPAALHAFYNASYFSFLV